MRFRIVATALALIGCSGLASPSERRLILGVLEDVPGHYAGESNIRTVRVVFEKRGPEWRPFRSNCPDQTCLKTVAAEYPQEMTWTISFDGRRLGQVTSRTPKEFHWYAAVGQGQIISEGPVPTIGKRSTAFGGFTEAAVYRPLVANTQPFFVDIEVWKPVTPSGVMSAALRNQFRKKFPKLCRGSKTDTSKLEPFAYRNEEIAIVKVYASKTGWVVARLHLQAIDCEDVEAGFDIDDPWFVIGPQESVKYLDSGMWLVDAGDYDNDGKSELLFSIDRYNRGGYELFYADFEKRAVFEFSYH